MGTRSLIPVLLAVSLLPGVLCQDRQSQTAQSQKQESSLSNKDVLFMVKAGLSTDVVLAKIQAAACEFDTSPSALQQLKSAEVPESVILAMVRAAPAQDKRHSTPQEPAPIAEASTAAATTQPLAAPVGFIIDYARSQRVKQSEQKRYDDTSGYLAKKLSEELQGSGISQVKELKGGCCLVSINVIDSAYHQAAIKDNRYDVTAQVRVVDASGKTIYSRAYNAEKKAWVAATANFKNASNDVVIKIISDEAFLQTLRFGRP